MDIIYKRLTENELDTFIQIWRITIIGIWQMEHLSHGLQRMGIRL